METPVNNLGFFNVPSSTNLLKAFLLSDDCNVIEMLSTSLSFNVLIKVLKNPLLLNFSSPK